MKLSLKCLAAKIVKAYNIPYIGHVPKTLESFIELHGPGRSHTNLLSSGAHNIYPEFVV